MPEDAVPYHSKTHQPGSSGSGPKVWQPPATTELQAILTGYEVTQMIGRGGMGAVYRGVQANLERPVAIKILPPDLDDEEGSYAARFKNEARAMAKLNHPGIVKVFDFGETPDGLFYFVMEFIEGTDVSRMIARKGRLAPDNAVAITAHVCDALQYAHDRGIIHRDIKPANIMVGYDGVVKVADFGLAKMTESAHSGLTRSGMAMGTLHYMAPEALTLGGAVDHRADIYAVGVMFYHMLAGRLPQGIFEPLHQQFPELDERYDDIVARAMRDDRELRYPSTAALRADLDSIISQPVKKVQAPEQPPAALPTAERPQRPAPTPPEKPSAKHPQVVTAPVSRSRVSWLPWAALLIIGGAISWLLTEATPPKRDQLQVQPSSKLRPFTNSLGMKFVPVTGTGVLMCIHETRRRDYAAYASETPGLKSRWNGPIDPSVPSNEIDDHPVAGITWTESNGFCEWLSKKEGRKYRLPTDREWSFAVGIGDLEPANALPSDLDDKIPGVYPWGTEWPPPVGAGNIADERTKLRYPPGNSISIVNYATGYDDGYPITAPVMRFKPNALGLYDIAGNVSEWCLDWASDTKTTHVLRGSSWKNGRTRQLSSFRFSWHTDDSLSAFGFRLVIEVQEALKPLASEDASLLRQRPSSPFTNSLGMKFVSVPGTDVQFCVHETRRKDYAAYAAEVSGVDGSWKTAKYDNVPCGDQDNHPVVAVSWEDAQAFCTWLSKKEGRVVRLPTDAEWSLAVGLRGEDSAQSPEERGAQYRGLYPWGPTWPPLPKTGNFADTSTVGQLPNIKENIAGYNDGFMTTCPVMTYPANAFGLHDLEGNVSEWTADWFNGLQERRAVRGGSWAAAKADHLLSTRRSSTAQNIRYPSYGFRVVVEPASKTPPPLAATTPKKPVAPPSAAFTNSLGMKFVPVPGTQTLFCIHETRRQDYEVFAKENPEADGSWKSLRGLKIDEARIGPVHSTGWHDAKAFCAWLSRKEGITYRLPTDREWSHAVGIAEKENAKATPASLKQHVKTHFPWGTEWPPPAGAGNYGDASTKADFEKVIPGYTDNHPTTAPVMSYSPNSLGLYDLGGNVGEWCEDWFDEKMVGRVIRGGSFGNCSPGYLLSSNRHDRSPDTRFHFIGFRVIAEAAAPFPVAPQVVDKKALPAPVTNSMGMRFVPVPGTDILMCVHETRRRDYAPYHATVAGVDQAWKSTDINGVTFKEDDNLPVMRVSWEDAMLYADWLSKKEGRLYRLPTDREWSHAVGIATDEPPYLTPSELNAKIPGVYPWGSQWPPPAGAGNYADDEASTRSLLPNSKLDVKGVVEGYKDGFATISPVMSLKPNALGLYDLGGNVQEWCMEWFDEKAGRRVMRGAGWNRHEQERLLASRRDHTAFDGRGFTIGFRLVLVPGAKPPAPEPLKLPPQPAFTNTLGMRFVPVPGTDICMCVHETRRGDYAKFAAENPAVEPGWKFTLTAGRPDNQADDYPIGSVSWNDATAFCQWLSKKESRTYRLPTDREWSCAVGIGQDEPQGFSASVLKNRLPGVYPWGKEWPPKSAVENFADTATKAKLPPGNNIGLNAYIEGYTDGFPTTARVMSFPPNALGIYDLGGNVREWCIDHGNSATTGHVMRGGCWKSNDVGDTVSAFRFIREPDKRSSEYGFRIVAEPVPAKPGGGGGE